jgi:hypothetical protein
MSGDTYENACTWPTLRARLARLGWVSWRSDDPEPTYFIGQGLNLGLVPDIFCLERIVHRLETERTSTLVSIAELLARREV